MRLLDRRLLLELEDGLWFASLRFFPRLGWSRADAPGLAIGLQARLVTAHLVLPCSQFRFVLFCHACVLHHQLTRFHMVSFTIGVELLNVLLVTLVDPLVVGLHCIRRSLPFLDLLLFLDAA